MQGSKTGDGTGFRTLHSFAVLHMNSLGELTNSDGNWLQGGLTFSGNTFYGTAMFGGISGYGTVFKLNTDGTGFMILHSFTAIHTNSLGWATNSDGMYPQGGLIISGNTLYGTTECGGSSGNGVAYAIHTDGTSFTNLHNFNSSDGDAPQGGLNISGNTLYGTTVYGGSSGFGSIFKLNSDGTGFMTLHSFTTFHNNSLGWATNSDGMYPQGGLITSGNTLYGTTEYGGSSGFGTLFAIRTDGTGFRNLHSCNSSNDVGVDVEILSGNTLYGTTLGYGYADLGSLSNNGTVFAVNTDGTGFTTLYSFTATSGPYWSTNSDGGNPSAGLVLSGNTLYGTAMYGGYSGYGTVFALSLLPSAPIITMQPQSQTAQSGNNVAFSVVASGWPSPNYQWQFNGQNIAAQTAASLSLTNVQFANAGGYSVVVTNTYGSVTSSLASLVIQGDPANWNPSFVSVTPQSAPADGQPHVTATVTLLDKNYNSLVGKTVQFYAQGSTDPIPTPAHPTDNNGQTTTTITAVTPGKVTIGAIDVSDSFPVPNSATLQFTTGSVVPGTALSGAITQLANSSANILNNDLGSYAITEGQDGDYFKATLSSDERANGVNALFTGIGLLTGFLGPEDDLIKQTGMQVAASEGISLGLDVGSIKTSDALDAIANSDTGLTVYGQNIANNNSHYQQSELLKEQQLLNGVPPSADNFSSAYVGDIGLRIKANQDLDAIVLAQKNLILNLRLQSEQAHIDMLSKIFIPVNMVATLGESVPFVGQLAGASLTLAESFDSYDFNQPNLSFGNFAANTANTAMLDCSYYSRLVDGNVKSAFGEIAVAKQPNPITGKISSVNSVRMYVPVSGALGVVGTVVGWFNGQTYVTTTGARSDVNIQNNNQQTATFGVNAVYWVTTSINDQLGDVLVPITIPYVASTSVTIPANQSAQVALNYFKNGNEAAPDVNQPITIYLLGYDSNNGIYEADFATASYIPLLLS